jgi:hypothetical protein
MAYKAEWQYDEAWTYLGILHSSPSQIAEYTKFRLANNHVFNSLYFHWLQGLGAKAEISYRLISLLSYTLYSLFLYRLLKLAGFKQGNRSYLILFLLPYMDFFALGRGYAPALACFAVSLYYYKSFGTSKALADLLYFVLAGSLATLSLFSFLFPFIAMVMLLALGNIKAVLKPAYIAVLLIVFPVTLYVYVMGKVVNTYDLYIIGGNSLFRNGALSSVLSYLTLSEMVPQRLFLLFKVALCITLLPAAIVLIKRRVLYAEHVIIVVTILLMLVAHLFFAAKYPMSRGLLYMLLLFYLPFVYSNAKMNYLVTAHLFVVASLGIYNMYLLLGKSMRHKSYDALTYVSGTHKPLFVDNVNPNVQLYNYLYFHNSIKVQQYEMEEPEISKSFYRALDTADFVICTDAEMEQKGVAAFFNKVYTFPDDELFARKARAISAEPLLRK